MGMTDNMYVSDLVKSYPDCKTVSLQNQLSHLSGVWKAYEFTPDKTPGLVMHMCAIEHIYNKDTCIRRITL